MRLHSEECRHQDSWISHCFQCVGCILGVTVQTCIPSTVLFRLGAALSVSADAVLAEQLALIPFIRSVGSPFTSKLLNAG